MKPSPRGVAAALPTLFAWHAATTAAAAAFALGVTRALGDSRWFATAAGPERVELALLAEVLMSAPERLHGVLPAAVAGLGAMLLAAPLASAACHRALALPGPTTGHMRWAVAHARTAYGIAATTAFLAMAWLLACLAAGWACWRPDGALPAPGQDLVLMAVTAIAAGGALGLRTTHDVAMASAAAHDRGVGAALAAAMRTRLAALSGIHLVCWLAIATLWGVATATGFALLGPVAPASAAVPLWHQALALGAAALRWLWLSSAAAAVADP